MLPSILLLVPTFGVLLAGAIESYSQVPTTDDYCTPVAGYCCKEGEDLAACAKHAGFDLPDSVTDATISTSTRAARTFTVTPFLAANPKPTVANAMHPGAEDLLESSIKSVAGSAAPSLAPSSRTCHRSPAITTSVVIQLSNTSASASTLVSLPTPVPSVIQVSIAAENRAVISYIAMLAVASVIAVL